MFRQRAVPIAVLLVLAASLVGAQTITVTFEDGTSSELPATPRALKKRFLVLGSGERVEYASVREIATDHFDAYELAVKRTSREGNRHVEVRFTGKEDVHVLRLERLEKKRRGAGAARGAGGLLMLLGAISGDRTLRAAGLATYAGGTIARDLNTEQMIRTQNEAVRSLEAEQRALRKADDLEAQYRIEYGDQNVDGLIALIDDDRERALAFANVAETAEDANHRWSAVWLKALVHADAGDRAALEKEYDRLIVLDPEVSSYEDASHWTDLLLEDLNELRQE